MNIDTFDVSCAQTISMASLVQSVGKSVLVEMLSMLYSIVSLVSCIGYVR